MQDCVRVLHAKVQPAVRQSAGAVSRAQPEQQVARWLDAAVQPLAQSQIAMHCPQLPATRTCQ